MDVDDYNNMTVAEKQRISWLMWYNTHSEEHNKARSKARDKKRGFIAIDSKHRTKDEPDNPTIKEKPKTSIMEKRRRKIVLDLAKVEKRRQEWAANQQNSKPPELVSHQQESL